MINPATFNFLEELEANNNREWFTRHKAEYEAARFNVYDFVGEVIKGLAAIDNTVPASLQPKDCVMRIYRDIRFSKDKTPYKTNFGAGISAHGKNFNGPGYYLHISASECFVAGGCWMPEADQLKLIRQEIDYNGSDFRSIVESESFKKYFSGLDTEAVLKTAPKGYPADHPDIGYLKLKSFTASHLLQPADLSGPDALKNVLNGFSEIQPLIVFLRNALS